MNHTAFFEQVKAGNIAPVYLMEGTEEYIKQQALSQLCKKLLPQGLEELNLTELRNPDPDALIAAAETLPFMADKRLIIVREHPALTGRAEADDRLLDYLQQVPESCVLVFVCRGKADARKKLYKAVQKHGTVVSFAPLTDAELNAWIVKTFAGLGKTVSPQTASVLSFTVGSDTALLRREIEKLSLIHI